MDGWLAGALGVVGGIVVDRTAGDLVVVPVRDWIRRQTLGRAQRRSRRKSQDRYGVSGEVLLVGPEKHPLFIHQFAVNGFDPAMVTTELRPARTADELVASLPPSVAGPEWDALAGDIAQEQRILERSEQFWNAEKLALRRVISSREPTAERPQLHLGFAPTDYAAYRVVGRRWEALGADRHERLDGENLRTVIPALSQSFGVNLTVETDDGHVLLTRRSMRTNGWNGRLHISVNEGMATVDVGTDGCPDPYRTAERGLEEELGLDVDRSSITLHTLVLDVGKYEWAFLGHVDLRGTRWTSQRILAHRALGAAMDDWETLTPVPCRFLPDDVLELLRQRGTAWVPHGYLNLLLSTVHRFPRERTRLFEAGTPHA